MSYLSQLTDPLPNDFSESLGKLLLQARQEKGWSQAKLARLLHMRRPSISNMENGRMVPDTIELVRMSDALDKPLTYFIPSPYRDQWLPAEETAVVEMQLLLQFRRLRREEYQALAVNQIRALANFEQEQSRSGD